MIKAATAAIMVRESFDWPYIFNLPFRPRVICGAMPHSIQATCQSRKTAKNLRALAASGAVWENLPTKTWEKPPTAAPLRRNQTKRPSLDRLETEFERTDMFGKIAGAMIGRRLAGRNGGTKGALLGYGAAALARRGFGPLAAVAALGWGAKKLYDRRNRRSPAYPSEATPSSPAD